MKLRKYLSLLLILIITFQASPSKTVKASGAGWADHYSTEWHDNSIDSNSFDIFTAEQLAGLAHLVNQGMDFGGKKITLLNDIDVSGRNWKPIGDHQYDFSGTFDGGGFKITGLSISESKLGGYIGVFGNLGEKAIVENLGITGANINVESSAYCGGLAGICKGRITNCYVAGTIKAVGCSGGLAGRIEGGKVDNCYTEVSIKGGFYTGGMAGMISYSVMQNSYSVGDVAGQEYTGGLIGEVLYNCTVKNCYSNTTVSVATYSGGLIGGMDGNEFNSVINCYAAAPVTGKYPGGLVSFCSDSPNFVNCYYIRDYNLYGSGAGDIVAGMIPMFADEMKGPSFVKMLNKNTEKIEGAISWLTDTTSVNGGYPVLTTDKIVTEITVSSEANTQVVYGIDKIQMRALVGPESAVDKSIIWSVSDSTLASISDNGYLISKASGVVTVTATSRSGYSDSMDITIMGVTGVTLNRQKLLITDSGASVLLKATVEPDNATDHTVLWTSSAPWVAVVENGIVSPVNVGTALVTATSQDGGKTAACNVVVTASGAAIISKLTSINGSSAAVFDKLPFDTPIAEDFIVTASIDGKAEEILQLTDFIWDESTNTVSFHYTPFEQKIASQSVVIRVEYLGSDLKTEAFTIDGYSVASIVVGSYGGVTNLEVGKNLQMVASVSPSGALDSSVTWSVLNGSGTASISSEGLLTATSTGTVTVVATANDGSGVYGNNVITIYTPQVEVPSDGSGTGGTPSDGSGTGGTPGGSSGTGGSSTGSGTEVSFAGQAGTNGIGGVGELRIGLSQEGLTGNGGNTMLPVPMKELTRLLSDPKITTITLIIAISDKQSTDKVSGNTPDGAPGGEKDFSQAPSLILSTEVLKAMMESRKELVIELKDMENSTIYTWKFDAGIPASLDQEQSGVNLGIQLILLRDAAKLIGILGDKERARGIVFRFTHEGLLPAQAKVRVYVGDQEGFKPGTRIFLYHYNPATGKLETLPYSSSYRVDEEGYVSVSIVHCSDYVALLEEADADSVTSLREQMVVTLNHKTLYKGGGQRSSVQITVGLPPTLKLVGALSDTASLGAIGGVTARYTSSDKRVAKVDKNGRITPVAAGKAVITTKLTLYSGKIKTVKTEIVVKLSGSKKNKGDKNYLN